MQLSGIYLALSTVLCLGYTYYMVFAPKTLLERYGTTYNLQSEEGKLAKRMMQYLGACMFVFGFIFGHMLPKAEHHKRGVRTAVMIFAMFLACACHGAFFDGKASEKAKAAAVQNVKLMGAFTIWGVVCLIMGMPKDDTKVE